MRKKTFKYIDSDGCSRIIDVEGREVESDDFNPIIRESDIEKLTEAFRVVSNSVNNFQSTGAFSFMLALRRQHRTLQASIVRTFFQMLELIAENPDAYPTDLRNLAVKQVAEKISENKYSEQIPGI